MKNEIVRLAELLIKVEANTLLDNFRVLTEINIMYNYEDLWLNHIEFGENYSTNERQNELLLNAFVTNLAKNNTELALDLFEEYYHKGVSYYITWTIIIINLINKIQFKLNQSAIDILLDIELNNYFGLASLEKNLKVYWLNNRTNKKQE